MHPKIQIYAYTSKRKGRKEIGGNCRLKRQPTNVCAFKVTFCFRGTLTNCHSFSYLKFFIFFSLQIF